MGLLFFLRPLVTLVHIARSHVCVRTHRFYYRKHLARMVRRSHCLVIVSEKFWRLFLLELEKTFCLLAGESRLFMMQNII